MTTHASTIDSATRGISVLVPTYQRATDLARCLDALNRQSRLPDEVLVVRRADDGATAEVLDAFKAVYHLRVITVDSPGVIYALNTALNHATGDILCITDDDAAPHVDWLLRIEAHFQRDATVGAVGGRDAMVHDKKAHPAGRVPVGQVSWFGRVSGNHHIGAGTERDVDHLKGVNMSFRRLAIQGIPLPGQLRGSGAQMYFEMAFCFAIKRHGWRIIYDPAVVVDHYVSGRPKNDERDSVNPSAIEEQSFNHFLCVAHFLTPSLRQSAAVLWDLAVGTGSVRPGVLRFIASALRGDSSGVARYRAAHRGRLAAWSAIHSGRLAQFSPGASAESRREKPA